MRLTTILQNKKDDRLLAFCEIKHEKKVNKLFKSFFEEEERALKSRCVCGEKYDKKHLIFCDKFNSTILKKVIDQLSSMSIIKKTLNEHDDLFKKMVMHGAGSTVIRIEDYELYAIKSITKRGIVLCDIFTGKPITNGGKGSFSKKTILSEFILHTANTKYYDKEINKENI